MHFILLEIRTQSLTSGHNNSDNMLIPAHTHIFGPAGPHLVTVVKLMRVSSDILQLFVSPFTNPEMMTNIRTSTLTAVKILFTQADSFTPKDRSPGTVEGTKNSLACG